MAEDVNLASMTEEAHYNRRAVGLASPTDAELDALARRVDEENRRGGPGYLDFVDAQSDLIDALLVRLDELRATQTEGNGS